MSNAELANGVFAVVTPDWATDLFEGLWPVDRTGVTYNSYLVRGDRTALIDLANDRCGDSHIEEVSRLVKPDAIDFIILDHLEPDHAGALEAFLKIAPNATIVCSPKARPLLTAFYGLGSDRVRTVADGEVLDLGSHALTFHHAPFVHWPETMMTWDAATKILFSCDAFGGFGATSGVLFDDQSEDIEAYLHDSLRYFTNIVAKFSKPVLAAITKIAPLPISIVAPGHGLIWRRAPERIIDSYRKWADCGFGRTEVAVTALYGSMYGNTKRMAEAVADGVRSEGVRCDAFDVGRTHMSYVLPSLWTRSGVVVAAPTYEGALYPAVRHALATAAAKRVCDKRFVFVGSWGWSGGALDEVQRVMKPLGWQLEDQLEFTGRVTEEHRRRAASIGASFARLLKSAP